MDSDKELARVAYQLQAAWDLLTDLSGEIDKLSKVVHDLAESRKADRQPVTVS